jgi:hypothetical protein
LTTEVLVFVEKFPKLEPQFTNVVPVQSIVQPGSPVAGFRYLKVLESCLVLIATPCGVGVGVTVAVGVGVTPQTTAGTNSSNKIVLILIANERRWYLRRNRREQPDL